MKHAFTLLCFLLFSVTTFAQFPSATMKTASAVDSMVVTDTGSADLRYSLQVPHSAYAFAVTFTKTSGTLGGTAKLQGSTTGSSDDWTDIGSSYTVTNTATQKKTFTTEGGAAPFKFFRVLWTGTGTMAGRARAKIFPVDW